MRAGEGGTRWLGCEVRVGAALPPGTHGFVTNVNTAVTAAVASSPGRRVRCAQRCLRDADLTAQAGKPPRSGVPFLPKACPKLPARRQKLPPGRNPRFRLADVKGADLVCQRDQNETPITIKVVIDIT